MMAIVLVMMVGLIVLALRVLVLKLSLDFPNPNLAKVVLLVIVMVLVKMVLVKVALVKMVLLWEVKGRKASRERAAWEDYQGGDSGWEGCEGHALSLSQKLLPFLAFHKSHNFAWGGEGRKEKKRGAQRGGLEEKSW